ncbi:MAG TPA: GntR family transcriptional regulator [Kofleriaceae bacterium]|jgi:GntR family transcriptional regulator
MLAERPLYAQFEEALAGRIAAGEFRVGARLPSEHELAAQYAVSRITIRQSIQNLVRRGLVEIRRGTGTFVTEPRLVHELSALSGFVEDMAAQGRRATARVIGKQAVAADATVARHLKVRVGTLVVRIQRVRLADGEAISFDDTYLPRALGERVIADDLAVHPIFELLERKYATPLVEAEYRLEAAAADRTIARALSIRVGSPLFVIERTSYTAAHVPVDYERLYYRGDRVSFVTTLRRKRATR